MTSPRPTSSKTTSQRKAAKAVSAADAMPVAEPVFPRETVPISGTKIVALRLPLDRLPKAWRGPKAGFHLMDFLIGVLRGPAAEAPESLRQSSMQIWLYGLDEDTSAFLEFRDFRYYWRGINLHSIYVIFSVRKEQPFFWQWLDACLTAIRLMPDDVIMPRVVPAGAIPVLALDRGRLVQYVEYMTEDEAVGPVPVYTVPNLRRLAVSYMLFRLDLDKVVREALSGQCSLRRPSLSLPACGEHAATRIELRRPRLKY